VRGIDATLPRSAYLDLAKDGQVLLTLDRPLADRTAAFSLRPTDSATGVLELRGYVLAAGGQRYGSSSLIYVEPRAKLRVDASASASSFRPGEKAQVRFRVTDGVTGKGVQAALGVVGLDEASMASSGLPPVNAWLFFGVSPHARRQLDGLVARPGGMQADGTSALTWLRSWSRLN
jgi:hypothetical protein